MSEAIREVLRRQARPLDPLPSGVEPVLRSVEGIRAVLFDVYGTLLISASGEPAAGQWGEPLARSPGAPPAAAAHEAAAACGLKLEGEGGRNLLLRLAHAIEAHHQEARRRGVEWPEVEIREIWRVALAETIQAGEVRAAASPVDVERLAAEYEARVNPVWPMPGAVPCLAELRAGGMVLGLVSNAQFFTPELFPALLGQTAEALGFARDLQVYSYCHGQAKPGRLLHERAAEALAGRGIARHETLCVGNDLLNDVAGARRAGMRAALFAGDARSLRLRPADARVAGIEPDLVLTDLVQLPACLAGLRGPEGAPPV